MIRRIAVIATQLAAAGFVAVIVLGFVPLWPLSLLEQFRVQCMFGGIAVALAAYFLAPRFFDAAIVALLVDLIVVTPHLQANATTKHGPHVRLLMSNVLASNTRYADVAALIAETKPDVIALLESNQRWFDALAPAVADYQRIEHTRADNFGIALYVKGTLAGRLEYFEAPRERGGPPSIVADVVVRAQRMTIVVTHPWPPVSTATEDSRDFQLARVARRTTELARPIVLAGDFNTAPWTRSFAKLVGTSGLCDTRAGFGYQGSYPTSSAILRIPIDHVLVSCDVGVRDRRIGPNVGSDHFPVIVDLVF